MVAAILHDVIEDTAATPDEIRNIFGNRVLAIVQEATDDKNLPGDTRKRLQIERVAHASKEAHLVKLADKFHNIVDMTTHIIPGWMVVFLCVWVWFVVQGLKGTCKPIETD